MSYKIVVDSCCELPENLLSDKRFERVPLGLEVGEYSILDDENFNQAEFLRKVAEYPKCPKSSCPSPERFLESYREEVDHVYAVTLSGHLSGSYNSAVLGKKLYEEKYGKKQIHVVDSQSASGGEAQIALKLMELEEAGCSFEQITEKIDAFRDSVQTYFVLDNLETLRKNGRLSGVKALVATTLSVKPLMEGQKGEIVQRGQAIGIKKGLAKLVDTLVKEAVDTEGKKLMITHCNCPERAELVRDAILKDIRVKDVLIMDTAGISSMYANDGGVIVTL